MHDLSSLGVAVSLLLLGTTEMPENAGYQIRDLRTALVNALWIQLTNRIMQTLGGDMAGAAHQKQSSAIAAVLLLIAALKNRDPDEQRLSLLAATAGVGDHTLLVAPTETGFQLAFGDFTTQQCALELFISPDECEIFCTWCASGCQNLPNWLLVEGESTDWNSVLGEVRARKDSGWTYTVHLRSDSILEEAIDAISATLPDTFWVEYADSREAQLIAVIALFAAIIRSSDSPLLKQAAAKACTKLVGAESLSFGFHSGGFNLKCGQTLVTEQTLTAALALDARRAVVEFGANVGGLRNRYRIPAGMDFGPSSDRWEQVLRQLDR